MPAPLNTLVHARDTPDTLRSVAWLDLAAGPLVLTVPDTCGRYYALWLMDDADNVFASIGPRTTGTGPGGFGLLGPPWHGTRLPPGITPIAAPTLAPRVIGCIEAAGERDDDALRRAYDGFRLAPLTGAQPLLEPSLRGFNGASAIVAAAGHPVAPATDVLHTVLDTDNDGHPLSGEHRYVLRFGPDAAPPVHGFWSLSTCAATEMHATGDLHGLAIDLDGSLPIYIQHRPPARERRSNWLPAPADRFSVALDLYWPAAEALQERWAPPPLERAG